jgi:hypothetical protein
MVWKCRRLQSNCLGPTSTEPTILQHSYKITFVNNLQNCCSWM